MKYSDLRGFIEHLELQGELKRVCYPVSPHLEMTEIADRVLKCGGPALLFEKPIGYSMPVLCNLFGTVKRVALAMGREDVSALRELGELLAFLREPPPPKNWRHLLHVLPKYRRLLNMSTKTVSNAPCQEIFCSGGDVSLNSLPIMHCWPQDVGPLVTWGLTITRGPYKDRQNIGIYRLQKQASNKLIMRWLPHRGGAIDFKEWQQVNRNKRFPVVVALGADPSTILAAVTPIPDTFSEYAFAGLLRGSRSEVTKALSCDLNVPANAEIILEGYVDPGETATEGPHGDHTGYYNEIATFPVMTVTHVTQRKHALYHSTYTGRPEDEPAILGLALNEVFIPILQKQFPEIVDFYLPPEGCSYRVAIVTMKKQYPGHAKRIMMGVWSYLRQFMYTKFVIVCDSDINARDWKDVIWAISTRMDPHRDTVFIDNTPIDYLDFASPVSGLGSKMGFDATSKWPGETSREWGRVIKKDPDVVAHIDKIWQHLGL